VFETFRIDQLVVFVAAVEEGSFSAAGRKLGRVQSAVSHAIAGLESSLGVDLFDRSGRRPTLTAAGRRMLVEAELVLGQARSMRACAEGLAGGARHSLELAVNPAYPLGRLASVVASLKRAFPSVRVKLDVTAIGQVLPTIRAGDADAGVGVLLDSGHVADMEVSSAGSVHMVAVCAPTMPLAALAAPQEEAALARHTQVVLCERGAEQLPARGVLAPNTLRVTDIHAKGALLRAGLGWGSMPLHMVRAELASGDLVRLRPLPWPDDGHRLDFSLFRRREQAIDPVMQWLVTALGR
jgi:DNA-binding transcriptional LysR family regulator